jgi:hypothetical protein
MLDKYGHEVKNVIVSVLSYNFLLLVLSYDGYEVRNCNHFGTVILFFELWQVSICCEF